MGGGLWERVARRGGNYNNTSNAGVAYLNFNNDRSNSNVNNGARPRSRTQRKSSTLRAAGGIRTGGAHFRQSATIENNMLGRTRRAARYRREASGRM